MTEPRTFTMAVGHRAATRFALGDRLGMIPEGETEPVPARCIDIERGDLTILYTFLEILDPQ